MDKVKESVKVSADLQEYVDWIHELAELGFEKIILHNVNKKQDQFLDSFGERVLPEIRRS